MAQYRDLHAGKAPDRIYVSLDIFTELRHHSIVSPSEQGFEFDGVPVEPKSGQSLPFLLRP